MAKTVDYMEFHLVDPTKIRRNDHSLRGATVLTVGIKVQGVNFRELGLDPTAPKNPRRADLKKADPTRAAHTLDAATVRGSITTASARLAARHGVEPDPWQHYYCSLCGGQLGRIKCLTCGTGYGASETVKNHLEGVWQPALPAKVVAEAKKAGFTFPKRKK